MRHHQILAATAIGCVLTGCQPDQTAVPGAAMQSHAAARASSPGIEKQLAELRRLTAPFQRFESAAAAGWGTRITECFSDPARGGMGYHYGNTALIDGTVDALKPELLLYEPQQNGELRLVAVEYVVPFTAWTATEPPKLYEQSFHRNETFGLWVLHVWHVRHNPSGMFMDWNPRVGCEFGT
jgi:hypothetical protein